MHAFRLVSAAFAASLLAPAILAPAAHAQVAAPADHMDAPKEAAEDHRLRWLDPVAFDPTHAFAPPPATSSTVYKLEFDRLRALIAAATPERRKQAEWDGNHEDPSAFSTAAGIDFATHPKTAELLATISDEVERMIHSAKAWYKRARPYQVDPALPHCGKGNKALASYPSGHGGLGWSVGWTLARLMPDRAPAILARAQDYALSREICGVHFSSDLEASHGAATAAVEAMLADPRLASQVAAAKAELAAH
jgi:acid phosphatase (class A)